MYKVTRRNLPKSLKATFPTYEKARSAVRKYIRKMNGNFGGINPPISEFGFTIQRI